MRSVDRMPWSITNIGHRAFGYGPKLASLTMGERVETIGWEAFPGCTSLTSLTPAASPTSERCTERGS